MRNAPEKTMWIFCGAFVVFGLIFSQMEEGDPSRDLWGGLSVLSLGSFTMAMVLDGFLKGKIRAGHSMLTREQYPTIFQLYLGLVALAGGIVLSAGFWVLILK